MFCPKCGTENPDANKFCRACRESLLVIAQAMKKRLPVMIVSKIDAALERLSERFRRDGILWSVFGMGMLIQVALNFGKLTTSPRYALGLLLGVLGLFMGAWSYLAYRRSLTLGERFEAGEFFTCSIVKDSANAIGISTLNLSGPASTTSSTEDVEILFCPTCGAKAEKFVNHCRSCGANLRAVRAAIEPSRWRVALNHKLDLYIERNGDKTKIRQSASVVIWTSAIQMLSGVIDIYKDRNPILFLLSSVLFVMGLWDYTASRRWFPEEEKRNDEPITTETNPLFAPTTNELALPSVPATSPMSLTEKTTRRLDPVIVQLQEEAETRKL
ncbi:MAG TPA: hypothetical protein VGB07_10600 [Blastocatellia bacterium]